MNKDQSDDKVYRRQVIEVGVAGAALLVLPEACSSSSPSPAGDGGGHDAAQDTTADTTPPADASEEPDATLVDGGGACEAEQTDWTRPISIMKAGIAMKGTAYAFTDDRFSDTYFNEDRILVINPLTGSGYVAMSGVCTHMGCCPEYYPACSYNTSDRSCSVPDTDGGSPEAGATEAGSDAASDAALDSPSPDTGSPDAGDAATDAASDEDGGSVSYTDILYCPCHGSVYDAKTGEAIYGPATGTGNLQIMKTCVGGGYVFVFIPDNMLGAGSDPVCGAGGEGTEP